MSRDALEAVQTLLRPHRATIEVTPTVRYTVRAPCLLRQLAQCVTLGAERGGRGVPGSRAPVNADVLDLWHEIAHNTHTWARAVGMSDAERRARVLDHPIPWVGRLLRTATATATARGEEAMTEAIGRSAREWARRITAMVTGTPEARGVRATCPDCGAAMVIDVREDDRERVQVYAVVLAVRDVAGRPMRWLSCRACGWTLSFGMDAEGLEWSGAA